MKISNNVLVSTPWNTNKHLPVDFPWLTFNSGKGVLLTLQGDVNNIHNLQKELQAVKDLINKDANKFNIKLRTIDIQIDFLEGK